MYMKLSSKFIRSWFKAICYKTCLTLVNHRARNYWVSGVQGQWKMVTEIQILEQVFWLETGGLSGRWTTLNLGFSAGNSENAKEIQILRQVFRTETQVLIVISNPETWLQESTFVHTTGTKWNLWSYIFPSVQLQGLQVRALREAQEAHFTGFVCDVHRNLMNFDGIWWFFFLEKCIDSNSFISW